MRYLDKNELRQALPLAYVAEFLGFQFNEEGKALCQFHDDTDPSFELRRDEDAVERWNCWPCGVGGDVYDLIMRKESLSFPEAINRAEEIHDGMPPDWQPTFDLDHKAKSPPEDAHVWVPLLEEGRRRAMEGDNDGMLCVIAGIVSDEEDEVYRRAADRFIRDQWGWGIDERGNVLIPHRDEEGRVTGIKVRALGGYKWSRTGSRYEQLYGAWLPRRHRDLLLTEGESDAIWGSLQPGINVDVMALPRGAGSMRDEYVKMANTWGSVYLAFDADGAGIQATRDWLAELGPKARVCRLPHGHDLRSAKPDLKRLLNEAVEPTPVPAGVQVLNNVFVRVRQNTQQALTSWYCEPTARLIAAPEDPGVDPALQVEVSYGGQRWDDVLGADDLTSASKFKKWAGKRSLDCIVTDSDVALIQAYLTARAQILPDVYQTPRVGMHVAPDRYRYAGKSLVLPDHYMGKLPWRFVGQKETVSNKIGLKDDGPIMWSWLSDVLTLNEAGAMQPLLAWMAAAGRRSEVQNFPIMFISGSSGAGKSTTAQLLCRMFGSQLGGQLGAMTAFPLIRLMSISTTLPVFIDEWTRQSREDTRSAFQGNIPIIYEGGIAERGRADQTISQYRCTAPIIVAGEDTFSMTREVDRMATLNIGRAHQNPEALQRLAVSPIERFGYWYSRWLLEATDLPEPPQVRRYPNRPEYNVAVLRWGWQTLRAFLDDSARYDHTVPQIDREPNLEIVGEMRTASPNEYEVLVDETIGMTDRNGHPLAWIDPQGMGTWVRFRAITSPDVLRQVDVQLPGGAQPMAAHFRNNGYTVTPGRVSQPISHRTLRASLIEGYTPQVDEE